MVRNQNSIQCGVLVLAAGLGKRMKSSLPKVLHPIRGRPLLFHLLDQVLELFPQVSVAIVVGYQHEQIKALIQSESKFQGMDLHWIHQAEQLGTGHAARCAMDSDWGKSQIQSQTPVLVLPGDLPLVHSGLIRSMALPLKKKQAMRLLVCELEDPTGYGRVIRKHKNGPILRIREERDANLKEKLISLVSVSIYLFEPKFLRTSLHRINCKNAQSEYYLTDLIDQAVKRKKEIDLLYWDKAEDVQGVNDLWELAQADRLLNLRMIRQWALRGVRFIDPYSTFIDSSVTFEEGVTVHPGVVLKGKTTVGSGTEIGIRSILKDVEVGQEVCIRAGTIAENSKIGSYSQVGPYAHLRPETQVGLHCKIGNFVELKKTSVGAHTHIAHLSYLGDAVVGKNVNIGCGFVTCNFDGRTIQGERKHKTLIGDGVFLGSDCQTVAPVKIGDGAYIASGSTITQDVPPEDLAIARSRQVNKPGYARRIRQLKKE